jgi:hypothetical protein
MLCVLSEDRGLCSMWTLRIQAATLLSLCQVQFKVTIAGEGDWRTTVGLFHGTSLSRMSWSDLVMTLCVMTAVCVPQHCNANTVSFQTSLVFCGPHSWYNFLDRRMGRKRDFWLVKWRGRLGECQSLGFKVKTVSSESMWRGSSWGERAEAVMHA